MKQATCITLKDIMLSEIRQSQKGQVLYDSTNMNIEIVNLIETEYNRIVFARGWEKEKMGNFCLVGIEFQL